MNALELHAISKAYKLENGQLHHALREVSFSVPQGQSLGIIGHNGAGKSTLLKLLACITFPTSGQAFVDGSFSALMEVGIGFHPDLSGRDNIYLNGSIIGIKRRQIEAELNNIIAFAGVGEHIDEPLRTFSSGMRLRLAFAVLAHLTTDILALDEVLAVGDTQFQVRCMERIFAMKNEGRTILFVSHNLAAVRKLCDRIIVINKGAIAFDGNPNEAIAFYTSQSGNEHNEIGVGTYLRSIASHCTEKEALIKMDFFGLSNDAELDFGVNISDKNGNALLHFSNRFIGKVLLPNDGKLNCDLHFEHGLKPGNYQMSVYVGQNEVQLDWIENAATLVVPAYNPYGFHNPDALQAAAIRPFEIVIR